MQYEDFVNKVEMSLQPIRHGEAERAAVATLSSLSEIINSDAAKNLGEHLPTEIADKLNYASPERTREFAASELTLDDFSEMVAEKEGAGVNTEEGRNHAIGVMKIVKEAYGAGNDPGSPAERSGQSRPRDRGHRTGEDPGRAPRRVRPPVHLE